MSFLSPLPTVDDGVTYSSPVIKLLLLISVSSSYHTNRAPPHTGPKQEWGGGGTAKVVASDGEHTLDCVHCGTEKSVPCVCVCYREYRSLFITSGIIFLLLFLHPVIMGMEPPFCHAGLQLFPMAFAYSTSKECSFPHPGMWQYPLHLLLSPFLPHSTP